MRNKLNKTNIIHQVFPDKLTHDMKDELSSNKCHTILCSCAIAVKAGDVSIEIVIKYMIPSSIFQSFKPYINKAPALPLHCLLPRTCSKSADTDYSVLEGNW